MARRRAAAGFGGAAFGIARTVRARRLGSRPQHAAQRRQIGSDAAAATGILIVEPGPAGTVSVRGVTWYLRTRLHMEPRPSYRMD